jgi:2-phospho-L-lactate guanylyltransferase
MPPETYAILPVNLLSKAKTRLSPILSPRERGELVLCMLGDVLDSLSGIRTIVVSPEDLRDRVQHEDVEFIVEGEKRGLTRAVAEANTYALGEGAGATLFIPVDTPLIKRHHVEDIIKLGREHPFIISPSSRGGVGPIYRRPPDIIDERFSTQSFRDYLHGAREKGIPVYVYESFELGLDIDTPEDIEEFMRHGEGTRTYKYLLGRSLP